MLANDLPLNAFNDPALTPDDLLARLAWLRDIIRPRLERFLGYYRNPTLELATQLACAATTSFHVRPFRQYQELGLPARITGFRRSADGRADAVGTIDIHRKEVVIENDIGWRINTLVDFAANALPAVTSVATNTDDRTTQTRIITAILRSAGGLGLLQNLVLEGAITGSAWIQLRPTPELLARFAAQTSNTQTGNSDTGAPTRNPAPDSPNAPANLEELDVSRWLTFEIVEATRLCPLLSDQDSQLAYAALLQNAPTTQATTREDRTLLDRLRSWIGGHSTADHVDANSFSFVLFSPDYWQRYVAGVITDQGPNPLGIVPFIRYENQRDPAAHSRIALPGSSIVDTGFSDVEPLIGLQDELNTRLSDRASRVTMTAFRMYLGKGIEKFADRPVGPGQIWSTDNMDASIQSFGGDASAPSEDTHIGEVRDALDKISGVPPVAAGVIKSKIGNLTSAVALQMTLIGLLAKAERKRSALERTLAELIATTVGILDRAGITHIGTWPGIDINWPSALPENEMDRLNEAKAKLALGIPRAVVLSELGYAQAETDSKHILPTEVPIATPPAPASDAPPSDEPQPAAVATG